MKYTKSFIFLVVMSMMGMAGAVAQQMLPKFSFTDLSGKPFHYTQLQAEMPTLVFFFDPYCDHCQQQATWIKEAKSQMGNIQQVWVTTEEPIAAEDFMNTYLGSDWNNVHVLIDKKFLFDGYFGYSEIPSIYVYNKDGQRVKTFNKETPTDVLLRFL